MRGTPFVGATTLAPRERSGGLCPTLARRGPVGAAAVASASWVVEPVEDEVVDLVRAFLLHPMPGALEEVSAG